MKTAILKAEAVAERRMTAMGSWFNIPVMRQQGWHLHLFITVLTFSHFGGFRRQNRDVKTGLITS